MWTLVKHSTKIAAALRSVVLNNSCAHQIKNVQRSKVYYNTLSKQCKSKQYGKGDPKPIPVHKIAIAVTCGGILHITLLNNKVQCTAKKSRMIGYKSNTKDIKFDWVLFWHYLKPYLTYFIAAIFGALAVAILNIQIPQLMGTVVNVIANLNENKSTEEFLQEMKLPAIKLIAMYVTQSFCTFFYIYMLSNMGEEMAFHLKKDLFSAILKQDIAFFDQQRTGEIINRLTTDVQEFKSSFKQTISGGLRAFAQIIGCSLSLLVISPPMTLVTLLCISTVVAIGRAFGDGLGNISKKAQAQIEKSTAVADEAVSNIRTVRAFAMEEQEQQLFDCEAEYAMLLNENLGFGIGWFQAGTNLFLNGMTLITLYMGGYLLSTNSLSAGDLMAFLIASQTIQRSLGQISLLYGSVVRGMTSGARVFEYLKLEPTMTLTGGETIADYNLRGDIEFKDVTFAYPTRSEQTILQNFNLRVPAGKTVALVGASGNGKSTVVVLLERFYDIKEGTITLDGHDIRTLDPSWLRQRAFGLISQEPILFGTTVLENIRYGRPDSTDAEVIEAAKLANAHEFIGSFPQGYDTLVGERGATLSGGQKQRIAIARALLKNPSVLLLDEATSALDTESEKIVQSALDRARKGRTVIVIAHRLSTIKNADIIVVLKKGNIVEMGTHEELNNLHGYYWSLTYQQQEIPAG